MHHSLNIIEILEFICSQLDPEPWASDADSQRGALAALARTCQTFHGPALDVLWANQLSLEPLIRCFPSDLFAEEQLTEGRELASHSLTHRVAPAISFSNLVASDTPDSGKRLGAAVYIFWSGQSAT
jgi:hypothetical protein